MEPIFRAAGPADLAAIVALLADDDLGRTREAAPAGGEAETAPAYRAAFDAITADPRQLLAVVDDGTGRVVGTLQLTFLPYLTYQGGTRAQIEAVRIASGLRGTGVGTRFLRWAIDTARQRGCHLVQLTTDKRRPDAFRFYESLGFEATHEGMKLHL